ncbi:hypothetical protein [Pararhizobium sp. DWP1-1-3]|uniref:hypothetical protein n=1 Tax=Pararhizobium sp. DWP1-1-3 TaxID=2804652 RepID=UPI003CF9E704
MEIHSKFVGGQLLHVTGDEFERIDGRGDEGLSNILNAVKHANPNPIIGLYRDIETRLIGNYEIRAELTQEALVELRIRVHENDCFPDGFDTGTNGKRSPPGIGGVATTRDEQIRKIRRALSFFDMLGPFDALLAAWDSGAESLCFTEFRAMLPNFLVELLRKMAGSHPAVRSDGVRAISDERELVRIVVQGQLSDQEPKATGGAEGEPDEYLCAGLKVLHEYENMDNLVRYGKVDDTPNESEEIAFVCGRVHFVDDLDQFLTELIEVRRLGGNAASVVLAR